MGRILKMIYDKPFFIPRDKRHRFRGYNSMGYLPALEESPAVPEHTEPLDLRPIKNELLYLRNKINELSKTNALPERPSSYKYIYSSIIKETDNESV